MSDEGLRCERLSCEGLRIEALIAVLALLPV